MEEGISLLFGVGLSDRGVVDGVRGKRRVGWEREVECQVRFPLVDGRWEVVSLRGGVSSSLSWSRLWDGG
jgi:hypothetical protein